MSDHIKSIIPNSTQIPHYIIRELMPRLSDVELRVVLVITDQTLGWIEDRATGRRKEKDWISRYQLEEKTGKSGFRISKAIDKLIKKHIIEALDEQGELLETAEARAKSGGKIYYRLKTKQPTLFDRPRTKSAGVKKDHPAQIVPPTNCAPTKETVYTKDISRTAEPPARKLKSLHAQFVDFWHETTKTARGIKPLITGKDARNLKRVLNLAILTSAELEQLAVYFLASPHFLTFSPSLSVFLSAGILNGLQNRMKNSPDFWRELDGYASRYLRKPAQTSPAPELAAKVEALKRKLFSMPFSPRERTAIQEETAAMELAAKV